MTKSTKIIAALGVVTGFGVAALPLASYAEISPATTTVSLSVSAVDSISAQSTVALGTFTLGTDTQKTGTGTVTVNWHDSAKYTVSYTGNALAKTGGATPFAATTGAEAPAAHEWGISKDGGTSWLAAASGSLVSKVETKGSNQSTTVTYKAVIDDSVETGDYSGTITYTLAPAASN